MDWWDVPRKGWMIIFFQFTMILFLSGWLFSEYLNNPFMQQYVASIAPVVVPVLSVFFGLVAASTATTLYMRVRRVRREQDLTSTVRTGQIRKTSPTRKRPVPSSTTKPAATPSQTIVGLPTPKFIITEKKEAEAPPVGSPAPPVQQPPAQEPPAQQAPPSTVPAAQPEQSNQPAPANNEAAKP